MLFIGAPVRARPFHTLTTTPGPESGVSPQGPTPLPVVATNVLGDHPWQAPPGKLRANQKA
jgi:hypothetical protein